MIHMGHFELSKTFKAYRRSLRLFGTYHDLSELIKVHQLLNVVQKSSSELIKVHWSSSGSNKGALGAYYGSTSLHWLPVAHCGFSAFSGADSDGTHRTYRDFRVFCDL